MKSFIRFVCKIILVVTIPIGNAMAATEVGFGSNVIVNENDGVAWIQIKRTGDLSVVSTVWFYELWSDSGTTVSSDDVSYNPYSAPTSVRSYSSSGKYGWVQFDVGESLIQIPYTITNDQEVESSERLYFELRSPSAATLGDDSMYIRINDDDVAPPVIPGLSIYEGNLVEEGNSSTSYAVLSESTDHDVTFNVSTYYGTYQQANYLGEGGDYRGLVDKPFVIQAGQTRVDIPVLTYQNIDSADALYESFELRIEASSVASTEAYLVTNSTPIVIMDVPVVVTPPPNTLDEQKLFFELLETDVGTSSAAIIIGNSAILSRTGQTLDLFGLLSSSLQSAVTWLVGTTAYANEGEMSDINEVINEIAKGLRLEGFTSEGLNQSHIVDGALRWTSAEVEANNWLGLRAGDYVDGRLVIHQPWFAFDSSGDLASTNSLQGRFTADDSSMFSHHNILSPLGNSFDWSPVTDDMYVIATHDGTVVFAEYGHDVGDGNFGVHGMGNVVTLKLDKNDLSGNPIFITFGHLQQNLNPTLSINDTVEAGQIIGLVGNTGGLYVSGVWNQFPKHLHITVGSDWRSENEGVVLSVADGSIDAVPPVYILGFSSSNVASPVDLGITSSSFVTDYGFPQGDYDSGYGDTQYVAINIHPSMSVLDFYQVNQGYPGLGSGGDFPVEDVPNLPSPPSGLTIN